MSSHNIQCRHREVWILIEEVRPELQAFKAFRTPSIFDEKPLMGSAEFADPFHACEKISEKAGYRSQKASNLNREEEGTKVKAESNSGV